MKDIFLKVTLNILKKVHEILNDLPFLTERTRIQKVEKLKANLEEKKEYLIHIKNLKQALNHRLVCKDIESLNSIKKLSSNNTVI